MVSHVRPVRVIVAALAALTLATASCSASDSAAPAQKAEARETAEDAGIDELDERLLTAREPLLAAGFEPLLAGALESGESIHVKQTEAIEPGTYQVTMACMGDGEAVLAVAAPEGALEDQHLRCAVGEIATTSATFQLGEGVSELEISVQASDAADIGVDVLLKAPSAAN